MKTKQIIILCVIFGILALGILLKSWVRWMGDRAGAVARGGVVLAEFVPANLEKILIGRGNQAPSVELARENGVWKVKNLWDVKADPARVEKLIEKLHSVQGDLRASGKKFFADFGIQDEDAFSIKLISTGTGLPQDLRIGTKQAGETSFFVRKAASENVYLVEVNIAELLGIYSAEHGATSLNSFWADLGLFHLDPEAVTQIVVYSIKGEERTMLAGLKREIDSKDPLKSSWEFLRENTSSAPDPDKVLKFIATMNSVPAEKVVDPSGKEYGLEKPVWQLVVTESGRETFLNAGPNDEKKGLVYVIRSTDPTVFGVKTSFFNDLNINGAHFLKEAPAAEGSKKNSAENVTVGLPVAQGQAT